MKAQKIKFVVCQIVCLFFLTALNGGEFVSLFNGKDLTGWKVPNPNPFWRVENGILIGENDEKLKGSML
ncbi:MAG TPA: hypothetical protein PLW02_00430, partial [Verrucomicrobiota bacterium]|nr:hypothetical protein [Verrucomicrobiota bacterium]